MNGSFLFCKPISNHVLLTSRDRFLDGKICITRAEDSSVVAWVSNSDLANDMVSAYNEKLERENPEARAIADRLSNIFK